MSRRKATEDASGTAAPELPPEASSPPSNKRARSAIAPQATVASSSASSSSSAAAAASSSAAPALRSLTLHADEIVQVRPMLSHSLHYPFVASELSACKASLESEGYLLLRGLLPRETIMDARRTVIEHLRERGLIHAESSTELQASSADSAELAARAVDPTASTNLLSAFALHRSPAVLSALEHPRLFELIGHICDPAPVAESAGSAASASASAAAVSSDPSDRLVWTSDYKWLRGVARGLCTGWHVDRVYMRSQQNRLLSLWMPLGDLTQSQGSLVAIPSSHRSAQFQRLRDEYAQGLSGAKGNGTTSGWIQLRDYTDQPIEFVSSSVTAGDVIVLDLSVLHCTSQNLTDEYRLSADTRWTVTQRTRSAEEGAEESCAAPSPPEASIRFHRQRVDHGGAECLVSRFSNLPLLAPMSTTH